MTYPEIVKEILVPIYHVYKPYLMPDKERDVKKLKAITLTIIPFLIVNREKYLMCSPSLSMDSGTIYPFLNMKSNKRWLDSLELFFVHLRSELNQYSRDCLKGEYGEENLPLFGDTSQYFYNNSKIQEILKDDTIC